MALRLTRPLSCIAACLALLAPAHGQLPADPVDDDAVLDAAAPEPSAAAQRGADDPLGGGDGDETAITTDADGAADVPADDVPADVPADVSSPIRDPLITPLETRLELDQLVAAEEFEAAQQVAERLIELTEQEFGPTSRETLDAYVTAADAAQRAGDRETAERHYLHAVELGRTLDGVFSPLAIEPLTGLGDTYQQSGQYLNAISAYSEARTVNRRVYGLLNIDQIPLIDRMTASMQSMDRLVDADQLQLEALRLVERTHEPHSREALEALYKYARWLRDNGRFQEERDQYSRAIRTIREHYGETSGALVDPLRGIGNSFRQQRLPDGQGHTALSDALLLLESEASPDRLALAQVLRDIGDWTVAFSKVPYDGAEYRRAWRLLGEVEGGDGLRAQWFNGPEYVLREPISQRALSNDPDALDGHVLVRFDLTETGQPGDVAVVEAEPPGLKDEAVLRHVRRSRFRPQMMDGELVPGKDLALQFTYRYKLDEEADSG